MSEPESAALLAEAKALLTANGYVVLTEKSYRAAQERQRIAKVRQEMAEADKASQRAWMEREVFPWERHLVNRLTHVGSLATSLGATPEQMRGPVCGCGRSACSDTWEPARDAHAKARDPQNSAQASAHDHHEPPQPAATTTPLEAHT